MKKQMIAIAAVFVPMFAAVAGAQEVKVFTTGGEVHVTMPVETKALKGAPYSAEVATDSTQTLADGNRIVQRSSGRVYRDSQGRVRREEDRPSGNPAITIVDPVAGVSYSLDPENRVAWKSGTPAAEEIMKKLKLEAAQREENARLDAAKSGAVVPEEVQRRREEERKTVAEKEKIVAQVGGGRMTMVRRGGGEENRSVEQLPARQMEGVRVEGHRTTTNIAAGAIGNELPIAIVSEEWVSPELQVLVMTQRKDPRNGDSTYRLLNIVRRDPDPSLFQVPPDYTIKETGIRRLEQSRQER